MSYEFYTPGVYYYSDQNYQEAAEYIGTIIVKPKQKEHYIELTEKGFTQGMVYMWLMKASCDQLWACWLLGTYKTYFCLENTLYAMLCYLMWLQIMFFYYNFGNIDKFL